MTLVKYRFKTKTKENLILVLFFSLFEVLEIKRKETAERGQIPALDSEQSSFEADELSTMTTTTQPLDVHHG